LADEILALLEAIRQGDETAFPRLAEQYHNLTESAVARFRSSFEPIDGAGAYGIDDLRQDAALALYRAAVTYEANQAGKGKAVSFGLYAKICIQNALVSVLRKYNSARKKAERSRENSGKAYPVNKGSDPLEKLVFAESAKKLNKQIARVLSPYEKEIFDSYIADKSVREIAERLGKDEKSVSNALYRVKVKVKGLLKNQ